MPDTAANGRDNLQRRARPRGLQPSPSAWGEKGYYNRSGGFHRVRDREAYPRLLWLVVKFAARNRAASRWMAGEAAYRWRHRRCDTTDFHHLLGCMREPEVRFDDACYRMWNGAPKAVR